MGMNWTFGKKLALGFGVMVIFMAVITTVAIFFDNAGHRK